jgi:DNA-binding response OmpR family regulator
LGILKGDVTMKNILVADDQPAVRRFLAEDLTEDGYLVRSVAEAREVRAHIERFPTDVVLLDLYLDGPEGWRVLREIKDHWPTLPVIIYTAYDTYVDDPGLSMADGFVVKSFDLTELKQTICGVLQGGETAELRRQVRAIRS